MILRGGENIYGAEVEFAVFDHPAVLECVAFAVPDERLGEEVVAVHLKDGAMLDASGLASTSLPVSQRLKCLSTFGSSPSRFLETPTASS